MFKSTFQLAALLLLSALSGTVTAQRLLSPEDLFRIRQVGNVTWSPDSNFATVELSRPGKTLDPTVFSNEIMLINTRTGSQRILSSNSPNYIGFSNVVWSPGGSRLAFLSLDSKAVVQAWTWSLNSRTPPTPINAFDVKIGSGEQSLLWVDEDRLALVAWIPGALKSSTLTFRVLRGGNSAKLWQRAYEGKEAAVSNVDTGSKKEELSTQLVLMDLHSKQSRVLARGKLHRLGVTADRSQLRFLRDSGDNSTASVFQLEDVEAAYSAVNWGTDSEAVDITSGQPVASPAPLPSPTPAPKLNSSVTPPRTDARRVSISPDGNGAMFTANANDGSHLWLCTNQKNCSLIWRGNEWASGIKTGRAELLTYKALDGSDQKAWLLLPPDYTPGTRLPVITYIYPGSVYSDRTPGSFSLLRSDFEHPQLFAALGYGVLLPSMPAPKDPADTDKIELLTNGVLPAVDAAIEKGFADPKRVAIMGQSAGGFATLGLLTETNRFRSAIASAGFSDFTSLYGTFYGQNRYGDGGAPTKGQLLRMLQMEKGVFLLGGPPWSRTADYQARSPINRVEKVQTPVMLIHGEFDFIPIQQAEQFFTALYRQDKRASLVRYYGEWHTITSRPNVLDMWKRMGAWLEETMR